MRKAGALAGMGLAVLLPAQALARKKPAYHGKHHTRIAKYSAWELSYSGSASWDVTETVTSTLGASVTTNRFDESSVSQWHYNAPTGNTGAAGFSVSYPTTCRQLHAPNLGPQPQTTGVGNGPSEMTFKIDDSTTSGSATQTLKCEGENKANTGAAASITATYVRHLDAYEISVLNDPLPPGLGDPNATCPGAGNPAVTPAQVWSPPDLPSPGPSLSKWWAVRTVTIPASQFASYSEIDIPVTLSSRNGAPSNCGIHSTNPTVQCRATGSWSGLLKLRRTSSS